MGYQESYVTAERFDKLVEIVRDLGPSFYEERQIEPVSIITLKQDITIDLFMMCEEGTECMKAGKKFIYFAGERYYQQSLDKMFGEKAYDSMRIYWTECFPSEEIFAGIDSEERRVENCYAIHEPFSWNSNS